MIVIHAIRIIFSTPTPVREGMTWRQRSLPPVDAAVLKSPENHIRSYGCGKGLSIAAPCNELPGISGFLVSVHRENPRGPLMRHLGFNRGSFSGDFLIGGRATHALGGGRRG